MFDSVVDEHMYRIDKRRERKSKEFIPTYHSTEKNDPTERPNAVYNGSNILRENKIGKISEL
jgi:hypothetical protein